MSDKISFPSEEWLKRFCEVVNGSAAYEQAAKTWEGDFVFVIRADPKVPGLEKDVSFYVDLWHGKCRGVEVLASEDAKKAEFVWAGTYDSWKKLIRGEVDPIKGLMTRKFSLKGNMGKVMRAVNAAKELVNCCTLIPTEFL